MYLYIVRSILGVGVTRHEIFERRFHVRLKANNSAEVSAHMSYTTNDRLLLLLLLSEQMNSSAESLRVARDTNRHQCAERHAIIHLASARLVTWHGVTTDMCAFILRCGRVSSTASHAASIRRTASGTRVYRSTSISVIVSASSEFIDLREPALSCGFTRHVIALRGLSVRRLWPKGPYSARKLRPSCTVLL